MISAEQKGRIKQYQNAAALSDAEYRALLVEVTGMRSTTEAAFSNHDVDEVMCHLEATIEQRIAAGHPTARWPMIRGRVASPRFWRDRKGPKGTPSTRERFVDGEVSDDLGSALVAMEQLGFNRGYCEAVARKCCHRAFPWGIDDANAREKRIIVAALERTIESQRKKFAMAEARPF